MRTIPPDLLIAPDFRRFSTEQVVNDGVLDLYLHRPAGPVQVNGGGYGVQTIQALATDDAFVAFFEEALCRLAALGSDRCSDRYLGIVFFSVMERFSDCTFMVAFRSAQEINITVIYFCVGINCKLWNNQTATVK